MDAALKKEWREVTTRLIISVGEQVGMEKNDQILMMMVLNTPEKVVQFSDWARAHTKDGQISLPPERVVSAAVRIGRGEEPLPDKEKTADD